jgi:hypothetical protein
MCALTKFFVQDSLKPARLELSFWRRMVGPIVNVDELVDMVSPLTFNSDFGVTCHLSRAVCARRDMRFPTKEEVVLYDTNLQCETRLVR